MVARSGRKEDDNVGDGKSLNVVVVVKNLSNGGKSLLISVASQRWDPSIQ